MRDKVAMSAARRRLHRNFERLQIGVCNPFGDIMPFAIFSGFIRLPYHFSEETRSGLTHGRADAMTIEQPVY
jgi:hypothetical protein